VPVPLKPDPQYPKIDHPDFPWALLKFVSVEIVCESMADSGECRERLDPSCYFLRSAEKHFKN
jgi:hypothetical protein